MGSRPMPLKNKCPHCGADTQENPPIPVREEGDEVDTEILGWECVVCRGKWHNYSVTSPFRRRAAEVLGED